MLATTLKQEFRRFAENTRIIRELSTVEVAELKYSSEYRELLKENFISIRKYSADNRNILNETLLPLLGAERELTDTEILALNELKQELLDAYNLSNLDLGVAARISERLMRDAKEKNDLAYTIRQLDSEIEVCYALAYYNDRIPGSPTIKRKFMYAGEEAYRTFEHLIQKEVFARIPDEESRAIVLTNYRYMHAIYEMTYGDSENNEKVLALLERCMHIASDPFYREYTTDYDWDYFEFRTLEYLSAMTEFCNRKELSREEIDKVYGYSLLFEEKWNSDPLHYAEYTLEGEMRLIVVRNQYLHGDFGTEEYKTRLLEIYSFRNSDSREFGNTYINLLLPIEYILAVKKEGQLDEPTRAVILQFYRNVISYAHQAASTGEFTIFLHYYSFLIMMFPEISETLTFEDLCLESFAALHPPTYVHSIMVAKLSRCLCAHLLRKNPALFIGTLGLSSEKEVLENESFILSHIYHGALVHDIGKIPILDTVFIYGRSFFDEEFAIIKSHTTGGELLAHDKRECRKYCDIIRNHHLHYDEKGGYPMPAARTENKILSDLVTVADCMDAATDSVGRSYATGKTLEEFIREVKISSGVKYSPEVCALLDDPATLEDLHYLLEIGRNDTYSETFILLKNVHEQAGGAADTEDHFEVFKKLLKERGDIRTAIDLIGYDLETKAPEKGVEAEIDALSILSLKEKECICSSGTEHLLRNIRPEDITDEVYQKSYAILWKEHLEQGKVPDDFCEEFVKAKAFSEKAWEKAKREDDFRAFEPYLAEIIEMTKRECAYIHPDRDPYTVLVDRYEEGMQIETIDRVFAQVRNGIAPILKGIRSAEHFDMRKLKGNYPVKAQQNVGKYLLRYIGFDTEAGCMGESVHPFTTRIGFNNVRVTNSYTSEDCLNPMFSIIHEGGHGLFEQGIDARFRNTPIEHVDHQMALHESQSRFYENILGRNINFWKPIYSDIQEMLPDLKRISLDEFEKAINEVHPSLIRVEADELTYCIHILLRYEMERAIFLENVPVHDLPELWRIKSRELLGMEPQTDREGILQDMHWSDGSFGYFPSYLLGSVYDGMFLKAMERQLGETDAILASGQICRITDWLRENIHQYGCYYSSADVIKRVCKEELSADALIGYFEKKYKKVYGPAVLGDR